MAADTYGLSFVSYQSHSEEGPAIQYCQGTVACQLLNICLPGLIIQAQVALGSAMSVNRASQDTC